MDLSKQMGHSKICNLHDFLQSVKCYLFLFGRPGIATGIAIKEHAHASILGLILPTIVKFKIETFLQTNLKYKLTHIELSILC